MSKINKINVFEFLTPKASTYFLSDRNSVRQAREKFDYHKFSVVPILNNKGEYVSSVSEGDILRFIKSNGTLHIDQLNNISILDIPHYRPYVSLKVDATFEEMFGLATSQNFIPVVDDRDKFIGIIKRKDLFLFLKRISDQKN